LKVTGERKEVDQFKQTSSLRNLDPVVREFAQALRQRLGPRVKRTVLFGSRARGDALKGSDYDVLIVVNNRDRGIEEVVLDIELDILNRIGVLVTGLVYGEEEWQRESQFPLGRNVAREGVEV
jgi:predicted nucleotidyltransferase